MFCIHTDQYVESRHIEKVFGLTYRAESKWYELGTVLGVPPTKLHEIRDSYADECVREVLKAWLNLQGPQPSWDQLVRAFQHDTVGYSEIAEAIKATYCPSHISDNQDGHVEQLEPGNLVYEICKREPQLKCGNELSESELEDETDSIQMKFNALVTNVRLDMQKQRLSPEDAAQHLKYMPALESVSANADTPLLNRRVEEIRMKPTLIAVFDVLSEYYSWFNYQLIENMIDAFCAESPNVTDQLQKFQEALREYSKERVFECNAEYGPGRETDVKELVLKVDKKWNNVRVKQLKRIRRTVANILKVKKHTLYLRTVENGCFQMTFLVPEFVAVTVFPLRFPTEQKAALLEAGVIQLHCDGYDLHLGSPSYESQESDSEVFTFC